MKYFFTCLIFIASLFSFAAIAAEDAYSPAVSPSPSSKAPPTGGFGNQEQREDVIEGYDVSVPSKSSPAVLKDSSHDNHEDIIHIIVHH